MNSSFHYADHDRYVLECDLPKSRIYCLSKSCSAWLIKLGEARMTLSNAIKQPSDLKRLELPDLCKCGFMGSTQDFPGVHLFTWLTQRSRWPFVSVYLCERFDSFRADKVMTWIELRDDESRASTDNKAIRAANNFLFLNNSFLFWDFKRRLLLESVSQALFGLYYCMTRWIKLYIQVL